MACMQKDNQKKADKVLLWKDTNFDDFVKFCIPHTSLVYRFGACRGCDRKSAICDRCKKHDKQHITRDLKYFLTMIKDCKQKHEEFVALYNEQQIAKFLQPIEQAVRRFKVEAATLCKQANLLNRLVSQKNRDYGKVLELMTKQPKEWKISEMTCDEFYRIETQCQRMREFTRSNMEAQIQEELKYSFTRQLLQRNILDIQFVEKSKLSLKNNLGRTIFQGQTTKVTEEISMAAQKFAEHSEKRFQIKVDISDPFVQREEGQAEEEAEEQSKKLASLLDAIKVCLDTKNVTRLEFKSKMPAQNRYFWEFFYLSICEYPHSVSEGCEKVVIVSPQREKLQKIMEELTQQKGELMAENGIKLELQDSGEEIPAEKQSE